MRERAHELSGVLDIRSDYSGAVVQAEDPVPEAIPHIVNIKKVAAD